MRATRSSLLVGAIALLAAVAVAVPAAAATTTSWATWQPLTGTGGAYSTSVQITPDPAITATVTSDSRAGQVGVISGASTWLSEGTPVGAKYGTSRDKPYLNLRPKADTPTGSSTTTYSFQKPTPSGGWTFVLGDIDADAVRIQATGPNGQALTAEQLGFRGGFNYCAPGVVGKPSCTGDATDIPSWDPTTLTLTGNAAAADTAGAAAWFEPNVPVSTLSVIFTRRSGLPVYQTWFASLARDISGSVRDVANAPQAGAALSLTDANGAVVATTTTAADGTYAFPGILAASGYTVRVTAPGDMIAVGSSSQTVDLTGTDAVNVDFVVRPIIPVAVSGQVLDADENPVPGATITVAGQTTTTDAQSNYLFDSVLPGEYSVFVTPPPGYTTSEPGLPIVVESGTEIPITGVDFELAENPDLSGTVTVPATGIGLAGVVVTATNGEGDVVTAVTQPLGGYTFPRLPSGEYTISITPPNGYAPLGPVSRAEQVEATDITGVDFQLALLGSFSGTVRNAAGEPLAGVVLTLTGPNGTQQLVSDEDGTYSLGGLPQGDYTLDVIPPEGTTAVDFARRSFGFPPQGGGTFTMQDFTLTAVVVVPNPDPDPPVVVPPGSGAGGSSGSGGTLPATGLPPETFAWAAGGAVVLILGATLLIVSRRRSGRDDS